MSHTSKIVMWVVVAFVIIWGIWYFMSSPATGTPTSDNTAGTSQTAGTNQPGTTNTSVTTVTTVTKTSPTPSSDTSDAAINQDAANIDGQMNALNADNSTADTSMNNPSQ